MPKTTTLARPLLETVIAGLAATDSDQRHERARFSSSFPLPGFVIVFPSRFVAHNQAQDGDGTDAEWRARIFFPLLY